MPQFDSPHDALRYHVTGAIERKESEANAAERHQLRIARLSMKAPCAMLGMMGGPNHYEAANAIHEITGAIVAIDGPCTCRQETMATTTNLPDTPISLLIELTEALEGEMAFFASREAVYPNEDRFVPILKRVDALLAKVAQ